MHEKRRDALHPACEKFTVCWWISLFAQKAAVNNKASNVPKMRTVFPHKVTMPCDI